MSKQLVWAMILSLSLKPLTRSLRNSLKHGRNCKRGFVDFCLPAYPSLLSISTPLKESLSLLLCITAGSQAIGSVAYNQSSQPTLRASDLAYAGRWRTTLSAGLTYHIIYILIKICGRYTSTGRPQSSLRRYRLTCSNDMKNGKISY